MKRNLFILAGIFLAFISLNAHAEKGEYWEVTSKMEMPGMPFAMPATTRKVCLPPGGEKDPKYTQDKKSNCEMTDVKTSGSKVSYKGKCTEKDGTMYMEGENTYERNSFSGTMHMTGKSQGEDVDMKMSSSGKRIGGSCDTEEISRKMQAQVQAIEKDVKGQMDKLCDTSNFNAYKWVSSASLFIGSPPTCPGKKDALCKVIRNDVPHDVQAFDALVQQEKTQGMPSAAKACNVNIESMKKSQCKARARSGPQSFLDANCPAEAKAYRELARKREDCEERGYTSGEKMKACMGGAMPEEDAGSDSASVDAKKANPSKPKADAEAEAEKSDSKSSSTTGNPTADTVLEGAKKLKGLFKF